MLAAMDLYSVLFFVGLGTLAGFLGGLIGIGGGFVLVPGFYFVFTRMGMFTGHELTLALGTALSSTRAHARTGMVQGDIVRSITPWVASGVLGGAALATRLDPKFVKWFFAAFCLISACRLVFMTPKKELSGESVERAELDFMGPMPQVAKPPNGVPSLFFGTICGMIGVGGANLFVPFLMMRKLCLRQAMATASALQIPISVAGSLAYVVLGWTNATSGSLGFIYVPALLVTGLISFIAAPFGARLSRAMSVVTLRKIFGAVTVGIGLNMAGAFTFLAGVLNKVPH